MSLADREGIAASGWESANLHMATVLYGGVVIGPMLAAAAELGLADLVADSAKSVDELARATGSHPHALRRVLSALAGLGVFEETEAGTFRSTRLSDTLREGAEGSLRDLAIFYGRPETMVSGPDLRRSIADGRPVFDRIHGQDWHSYVAKHVELGRVFNRAMGGVARNLNIVALRSYDFSDAGLVVDLGGGAGYLVEMILKNHEGVRGAVYDRPAVVEAAADRLGGSEIADRIEFVPGDFFGDIPGGADVYILSKVVHNWSDEEAVSILKNVRRAMPESGKLIIIDPIISDRLNEPHSGKLMDVIALTKYTGWERKESEVLKLLADAGLAHIDTRVLDGPCSLIVAQCA
jgi:SAM-dependent methyltransferase